MNGSVETTADRFLVAESLEELLFWNGEATIYKFVFTQSSFCARVRNAVLYGD